MSKMAPYFFLMTFLLSACSVRDQKATSISFLQQEKMRLPLKYITTKFSSCVYEKESNPHGLLKTKLSDGLLIWAQEHFDVMHTSQKSLLILIEEAEIKEFQEKKSGFLNFFASQDQDHYQIKAVLTLKISDAEFKNRVFTPSRIAIVCEKSLPSYASIKERRILLSQLYDEFLTKLSQEADLLLKQQLHL